MPFGNVNSVCACELSTTSEASMFETHDYVESSGTALQRAAVLVHEKTW